MSTGALRFGRFVLDAARRELLHDGHPVVLPARVFDCLEYLLRHRERAVGRDELISAVYGRVDVSDAQLGQLVLRARRAVQDDGQVQHTIRTIPRYGFRWVADTSPVTAPVASPAPLPMPVPAAEAPAPDAASSAPAPVPPLEAPASPPALERARTSRPRWPGWMFALALLLTLAAGTALWLALPPRASVTSLDTRPPLAVLPTRVDSDHEASWIRLGLMDFIGNHLRHAGLPVAPNDSVLALLPADDGEALRHLRARTGADHVVESRALSRDEAWQVELSATDAQGIRLSAAGRDPSLMTAARQAADRLLVALGRLPPREGDHPGLDEQLQRAQAAMLANQLELAREILVSATQLRRDDPLLRYQLIQVDFREGRYAEALAEIDALLALPEDRVGHRLRAKLLNTRGAIGVRNDRYALAEQDFNAALAELPADDDPSEWARARSGLGITRMAQQQVEQAARDLVEARGQMIRVGDVLGLARVDSNLGHVEYLRDRPAQALEYFAKSAQDFEALGAINELASAQSMLIETQLRLLQHDQAALAMQRYWGLRTRIRDPAQRALVDLARVKVLLQLGRLHEASGLLDPPLKDTRPTAFQLHQYALYRVEVALAAGRSASARQLAEDALQLGDELAQPVRDWLRLYRERAVALAERPFAAGGLSLALPPLEDASLPARLARALVLQREGHAEQAEEAFRVALEEARTSATPVLLVEVGWDYGPWLVSRRQTAQAAELASLLAPWARRDYRAASVVALLYDFLEQPALAADARSEVVRLAGERPHGIPRRRISH